MTCTDESYEAMAEAGWRKEDIELLEKEVELARQKAQAQAFSDGATRSQQQYLVDEAERGVRKIAHDRWHNELEDNMRELNALNAFAAEHPGEAYTTDEAVMVLAAGGEGGHKHLQLTPKKEA